MRMFTTLASLLLLSASLWAQDNPSRTSDAGGKWTAEVTIDKFTSDPYTRFKLVADEQIRGGDESGLPSFTIECGKKEGKFQWINARLHSPVTLGRPNTGSWLTGAPQQTVRLRANDKYYKHNWTIAPTFHSFFVDKDATKELLNSAATRIEFRDRAERPQVVLFAPAGINKEMVNQACGKLIK